MSQKRSNEGDMRRSVLSDERTTFCARGRLRDVGGDEPPRFFSAYVRRAASFVRIFFLASLSKKGWGSSNGWRGPCNLMFARQDFGEHGPSRNAPNAASPFMCRSGRSISTPPGCGICGNAKLAVTALKQRSISPRPDACPPRHSGDNRDNAARFPGRTGWTRRLSHICK